MPTADDVLRVLASGETAQPRLTHYDDSGRIELSGRVLLNWVAKAAGLLQEEFDVTVGGRVFLDLPPTHWRTAYWALATWAIGATLVTGESDDADVRVSASGTAAGGDDLVLVTLAALARSSPEPVPTGALDEAAVLSTYSDVLEPWERAEKGDPAWVDTGVTLAFGDLINTPRAERERVLIVTDADAEQADWGLLSEALSVWAGDGSVVVAGSRAALERISSDEAVTRRR